MDKQQISVQWVVQKNLTSREDLDGLREACNIAGVNCLEVIIIPFSDALPEFEITPYNIYYGSTTFLKLI